MNHPRNDASVLLMTLGKIRQCTPKECGGRQAKALFHKEFPGPGNLGIYPNRPWLKRQIKSGSLVCPALGAGSVSKHGVSNERGAAGAGIAALALLSQLADTLISSRKLSADELREALDAALLSLEKGQAESPVPEAADCARQCLEQLLARPRAEDRAPTKSDQKSAR